MAEPLAPLDTWPALLGASAAAAAAVLVPLTAFVKTVLDYKVAFRQAEATKPLADGDFVRSPATGARLADSIATADLTIAVRELTAAIVAATAADKAQHEDRIAQLVEKLGARLEAMPETRRPAR